VFFREHYFPSKSFAALHELFISAYPDEEVTTQTTVNRLVTGKISGHRKCLPVTSVRRARKQLKLRPCRLQAEQQLQQRDTAAGIHCSHWFVVLYA
jgi:hypothetical protein